MREALTVIIVLLIVAVVLDGVRRMRLSRRNAIRMPNNVSQQEPATIDDVIDYGSELPGGGARVVNVRKANDAVERNEQIKQTAEHKRRNQLKSFRIPEQVSLNLDQQVPTLMESVIDEAEIANQSDDDRIEPIFASDETPTELMEKPDLAEDTIGREGTGQVRTRQRQDKISSSPSKPPSQAENLVESPKTPSRQSQQVEKTEVAEENYRDPELVLVINVMSPKGEQFPGSELLDIILMQGLRFGTMNIFHRHEQENGDGEILYSMANIVMPGTFDLAKMKTFATPGVSFFLTLPMDTSATEAFEDMLTTAKIIAARFQGELKDESRSVLTPQSITHYRSKLQEFARKQLSKAPV